MYVKLFLRVMQNWTHAMLCEMYMQSRETRQSRRNSDNPFSENSLRRFVEWYFWGLPPTFNLYYLTGSQEILYFHTSFFHWLFRETPFSHSGHGCHQELLHLPAHDKPCCMPQGQLYRDIQVGSMKREGKRKEDVLTSYENEKIKSCFPAEICRGKKGTVWVIVWRLQ